MTPVGVAPLVPTVVAEGFDGEVPIVLGDAGEAGFAGLADGGVAPGVPAGAVEGGVPAGVVEGGVPAGAVDGGVPAGAVDGGVAGVGGDVEPGRVGDAVGVAAGEVAVVAGAPDGTALAVVAAPITGLASMNCGVDAAVEVVVGPFAAGWTQPETTTVFDGDCAVGVVPD
jgi:hypothetical protein